MAWKRQDVHIAPTVVYIAFALDPTFDGRMLKRRRRGELVDQVLAMSARRRRVADPILTPALARRMRS